MGTFVAMAGPRRNIDKLVKELGAYGIETFPEVENLVFDLKGRRVQVIVSDGGAPAETSPECLYLPGTWLRAEPEKVAGLILARLGLNQRVFARHCALKAVGKKEAEDFLNRYHLMGSTGSAYRRGLYLHDELLALATFSKGRKMNRLDPEKRSYELIRFCSKKGYTVSGGLSKLVKNFCREKQAGDVMSYVDRRLSEGEAFKKAGFEGEGRGAKDEGRRTEHEGRGGLRVDDLRSSDDDRDGAEDRSRAAMNVKMIYTCGKGKA